MFKITRNYNFFDLPLVDEINESINEVITEEMGISDEVDKETDKLTNFILKHMKMLKLSNIKNVSLPDKFVNGIKFKNGSFTYKVFGLDIGVEYYCFHFDSDETFNDYIEMYGDSTFNASSHLGLTSKNKWLKKMNFIRVNFAVVKNDLKEKYFRQSVKHELTHIYEQYKSNTNFSDRFDDNVYKKIMSVIGNPSYGEHERNFYYTLYLCFDYERRAYVNEFYTSLKDKKYDNFIPSMVATDNEIYDKVLSMKKTLSNINDGTYDQIIENFTNEFKGYSKDKIVGIIESSINDFVKRIGKAVMKFKKDFYDTNEQRGKTFGTY